MKNKIVRLCFISFVFSFLIFSSYVNAARQNPKEVTYLELLDTNQLIFSTRDRAMSLDYRMSPDVDSVQFNVYDIKNPAEFLSSHLSCEQLLSPNPKLNSAGEILPSLFQIRPSAGSTWNLSHSSAEEKQIRRSVPLALDGEAGLYLIEAIAKNKEGKILDRKFTSAVVSDVKLTARRSSKELMVWMLNAKEGWVMRHDQHSKCYLSLLRIKPGAAPEVVDSKTFDFEKEKIQSVSFAMTSEINKHLDEYYVVADNGKHIAFFALNANRGVPLYLETTVWGKADKKIYGPQDSLAIAGVVRTVKDGKFQIPQNFTHVKVSIAPSAANDSEKVMLTLPLSKTGGFSIATEVSKFLKNAHVNKLDIIAEQLINIKDESKTVALSQMIDSIQVYSAKKPTIDTVALVSPVHLRYQVLHFDIKARDFNGAPLKDGSVSWELFERKEYLADHNKTLDSTGVSIGLSHSTSEKVGSGESQLDSNGEAKVSYAQDYNRINQKDGAYISTFTLVYVIKDGSENQSVRQTISTKAYPFATIATASTEKLFYLLNEHGKTVVPWTIKAIDQRGEPAKDTPIYYKVRTPGVTYTPNAPIRTDQHGLAKVNVPVSSVGLLDLELYSDDTYSTRISVSSTLVSNELFSQKGLMSSLKAEAVWSSGDRPVLILPQKLSRRYEVGETVKFLILTQLTNAKTALVTIEQDKVLKTFNLIMQHGTALFELPLEDSFNPGVTLRVQVMAPASADQEGRHVQMVSSTYPISVEDSRQNILVHMRVANAQRQRDVNGDASKIPTVDPGAVAQIQVLTENRIGSETQGADATPTAEAVIFAIDKAAAALSPGLQQAIYDFFATAPVADLVELNSMDPLTRGASMLQPFSLCGSSACASAGGLEGAPQIRRVAVSLDKENVSRRPVHVRSDFRDSVHILPWTELKNRYPGNDFGMFELKMPDQISTYEVQAIVSSTDGKVGSATADVRVFKAFEIKSEKPDYFLESNSSKIRARIANHTQSPHDVVVSLKNAKGISVLEAPVALQKIPAGSYVDVEWVIQPVDDAETAEFGIEAIGGSEQDALQFKDIPIQKVKEVMIPKGLIESEGVREREIDPEGLKYVELTVATSFLGSLTSSLHSAAYEPDSVPGSKTNGLALILDNAIRKVAANRSQYGLLNKLVRETVQESASEEFQRQLLQGSIDNVARFIGLCQLLESLDYISEQDAVEYDSLIPAIRDFQKQALVKIREVLDLNFSPNKAFALPEAVQAYALYLWFKNASNEEVLKSKNFVDLVIAWAHSGRLLQDEASVYVQAYMLQAFAFLQNKVGSKFKSQLKEPMPSLQTKIYELIASSPAEAYLRGASRSVKKVGDESAYLQSLLLMKALILAATQDLEQGSTVLTKVQSTVDNWLYFWRSIGFAMRMDQYPKSQVYRFTAELVSLYYGVFENAPKPTLIDKGDLEVVVNGNPIEFARYIKNAIDGVISIELPAEVLTNATASLTTINVRKKSDFRNTWRQVVVQFYSSLSQGFLIDVFTEGSMGRADFQHPIMKGLTLDRNVYRLQQAAGQNAYKAVKLDSSSQSLKNNDLVFVQLELSTGALEDVSISVEDYLPSQLGLVQDQFSKITTTKIIDGKEVEVDLLASMSKNVKHTQGVLSLVENSVFGATRQYGYVAKVCRTNGRVVFLPASAVLLGFPAVQATTKSVEYRVEK